MPYVSYVLLSKKNYNPSAYMRKTQREKRLPCSTNLKRLRQNFHFDTASS